jgi:hypothetical protein
LSRSIERQSPAVAARAGQGSNLDMARFLQKLENCLSWKTVQF